MSGIRKKRCDMAYDFRIKTFTDERAYHNTAILIYLKAVKAALGDVDVTIGNSLNQGYYSYINKGGAQLTTSDIHKIRDMMDRFIAQDLEIVIENDTVGHAKAKWASLFQETISAMVFPPLKV